MSEQAVEMNEATEAPTPKKTGLKKPAAAKPAPAATKPGTKPAAKAKPAPTPVPKKPLKNAAPAKAVKGTKETTSIRQNTFELLKNNPDGLTGAQIMQCLNLKGVPAFLKDEGVCDKPRIKRASIEGIRGVVYKLTALGLKDLDHGKVDENAAEASAGKDWPANR
jgi:hypothetical protein